MTADLIFLLQAFVIVTVPFALSRALRLNGMVPLVVIQILLGIALGPSLFGRLAPEAYSVLFNPATLSPLSGAASIAVLFFGFITGLHIDTDTFRGRGGAFVAIAAASVVIPTVLGVLGGLFIGIRHPATLGAEGDLFTFASAIGICLGVTALPVLGAILREMGWLGGRIAGVALGLAAVNDAALWLLLGGLMTVVAGGEPGQPGILLPLLSLPIYLLLMAQVVRPLLTRAVTALMREDGAMGEAALVVVGACAIGSAVVTQVIGLHYIFGAFVTGVIVPRELRQPILDRLQAMTIGVLMPFFFMLTGLRTRIDPSSAVFVEILVVTTVLGVVGKIGGTAITARLVGETWSSALCLGTLMQTKGLMEVVVLTVLLERDIISITAFSALTLMAVISTALVMPLSRFLLSRAKGAVGLQPSGGNSLISAPLDAAQYDRMEVTMMAEVERSIQAAAVEVKVEAPNSLDARWCLDEYFRELAERFETGFDPVKSNPARDEEITPPAGCFVVARFDGSPIGCGALKRKDRTTGEIKRMWTASSARGRGVARKVLQTLETLAREFGLTTLRLETNQTLTEAQALYRKAGYREVAAFNDEPYAHHWFEKTL